MVHENAYKTYEYISKLANDMHTLAHSTHQMGIHTH